MYFEKTRNGIEYTEDIISCDGAAFMLFPTAEHTIEMVAAAKSELKYERDVVAVNVATARDWDERYRSEVFHHPFCRELRWYEINADVPAVIRYHRLKGTPVHEYITRFVLPCSFETKARNMQQIGAWIINS